MSELHEYTSVGNYQRRPTELCGTCGQPYDTDVHHVVAEGWCQWDQEDHDYQMGALECSRCGAETPAEDLDMCEGCGSLFEEDELNEDGYCGVQAMTEQDFQRVEEDAQLEISGGALPTPRTIRSQLRTQLNGAVLAERDRRGEVHVPEDTWGMQRSLAKVIEVCGEYSRAFGDAAKEAKQIAEEELIEAVGDQDGVPNGGMTVPDAEGDVKISLDTRNDYEIDMDALASAAAFKVLADSRGQISGWLGALTSDVPEEAQEGYALAEDMLASFMVEAIGQLLALGSFKPGVMKARQFVKELGRMPGADGVASSVSSSIRKTALYKGVKVERVQEK